MSSMGDKTALMKKIKDEVLELKTSPLYAERVLNNAFPVIGEGNHDADIMFIGEAPGKNEARTGRPFCGASGKLLDDLLEGAGLKREEVYITNIVKDRPPQNRDPLPEEIAAYAPYLDRQIDIIAPKVIATLGRYAMNYILERLGLESEMRPISQNHGQVFEAKVSYGTVKIIPLYHPAVAIYNRNTKDVLEEDFKTLTSLI